MQEASWQNAEVDALFRLASAGVRVPRPYICTDGVLLMELVVNGMADVAPRLNDVDLTEAGALELHALLLNQVVRMLFARVIHGDLWEYNILVAADGPVIIDLPQAVDAVGNNEAASMLKRDVENLAAYFWQFAPQILSRALESALGRPECTPLAGSRRSHGALRLHLREFSETRSGLHQAGRNRPDRARFLREEDQRPD